MTFHFSPNMTFRRKDNPMRLPVAGVTRVMTARLVGSRAGTSGTEANGCDRHWKGFSGRAESVVTNAAADTPKGVPTKGVCTSGPDASA